MAMRPVGLQVSLRPRGRGDEEAATVEKDFYVNLVVVMLLLIGGQGLFTGARVPDTGPPAAPTAAVAIYLAEHGALHVGSLCAPQATIEDVQRAVHAAADGVGGPLPVFIHHTAEMPAGFLHEALRAVQQVAGTEPFLALSRYPAHPCDPQEGSQR